MLHELTVRFRSRLSARGVDGDLGVHSQIQHRWRKSHGTLVAMPVVAASMIVMVVVVVHVLRVLDSVVVLLKEQLTGRVFSTHYEICGHTR